MRLYKPWLLLLISALATITTAGCQFGTSAKQWGNITPVEPYPVSDVLIADRGYMFTVVVARPLDS